MTFISQSNDFVFYLEVCSMYKPHIKIMSQCDATVGLKINVGHSDLYFMVQ